MKDSPSLPSGKIKAWNSRGGLQSIRLIGWRMLSSPHVLLSNISKYFWASWKQLCWRGREVLLIPYRFHILRRVPSPPICRPISGNEPSAGNFTLALPIVQCFPSCQMIGITPVVNFTPAVCENIPGWPFQQQRARGISWWRDAHTCTRDQTEREQEGASWWMMRD